MIDNVVTIHKRKRPPSNVEPNAKKQKLSIEYVFGDDETDDDDAVMKEDDQRVTNEQKTKTYKPQIRLENIDKIVSDETSVKEEATSDTSQKDNIMNTCYLCNVQHQPKDYSVQKDTLEEFIERTVLTHYEEAMLYFEDGHTDTLDQLLFAPMKQLVTQTHEDSTTHLELEPKVNVLDPLQVSLIIKLYANQFSLEIPSQKNNNGVAQSKPPAILKYNQATRAFLKEIAANRLVPEVLEEISELSNLKYYDGAIVVQITDMREQELQQKMNQQQEQVQLEQKAGQTTPTPVDKTPNRKKRPATKRNTKKVTDDFDDVASKDNSIPVDSCTLLLKQDPEYFLKDVNRFIDEQFSKADFTAEQRLDIIQRILLAKNRDLCLSPDAEVGVISNALHVNKQKSRFRRRKRSLIHTDIATTVTGSSSASTPNSNILPSVNQAAKKYDHSLLNYVLSSTKNADWKSSTMASAIEADSMITNGKKKKHKAPSKQKKQQFASAFPKNMHECSPTQFLTKTEQIMVNNKNPARTRTLKFQTTHDKNKIWRVQIIPYDIHGKRFDAIIVPTGEQGTTCTIGGKHATDLYVRRLKDMFTSNGKTKLIFDQEADFSQYQSNQGTFINKGGIVVNQAQGKTPAQTGANPPGVAQGRPAQPVTGMKPNAQNITGIPTLDQLNTANGTVRQPPTGTSVGTARSTTPQNGVATNNIANPRRTPTNGQGTTGTSRNTPPGTPVMTPTSATGIFAPGNLPQYNIGQFPANMTNINMASMANMANMANIANMANTGGMMSYPLAMANQARVGAGTPSARASSTTPPNLNPGTAANVNMGARNFMTPLAFGNMLMQNNATTAGGTTPAVPINNMNSQQVFAYLMQQHNRNQANGAGANKK